MEEQALIKTLQEMSLENASLKVEIHRLRLENQELVRLLNEPKEGEEDGIED